MRYEPFYVTISYLDKNFSDYGKDHENPQNCAKRILFENTGIRKEYVTAVDGSQFISVDSVPESVKSEWPNGAKSIPLYIFKA